MNNSGLKSYKTLKDWPEADQPREKLMHYGADTLSDAELLAILIRTGTKAETAVDIARQIIQNSGGIHPLGRMSVGALKKINGIGPVKAVTIAAAFQLGSRFSGENLNDKYFKVTASEQVYRQFAEPMRLLNVEIFKILLLNSNNKVYKDVIISQGHLNASVVHPREIFKVAIDNTAASIILMHNHPSGNPEPSPEDISITRKIIESGKIIGIPVLDHIIVADKEYTSFADSGLM